MNINFWFLIDFLISGFERSANMRHLKTNSAMSCLKAHSMVKYLGSSTKYHWELFNAVWSISSLENRTVQ